tara:strand:- start:156 stop:1388 length:1233 start_codon:yes stop_codon:yes gene_type:complete
MHQFKYFHDLRHRWYTIIFEADTSAGRRFDILLIWAIVISILIIMVDSINIINKHYSNLIQSVELIFTLLFTVEYIFRLLCSPHPLRYAKSFLGVIDLISIVPSFLALIIPETYVLIDVRILRLLRIFRVLKMSAYVEEYQWLLLAVADSRRKISVFLSIVIVLVVILGTIMYLVEGPKNGFTSVPTAIYWAISTLTTVGFGDIAPKTDIGRFISSLMMLIGWGIIAVPTGIVSAEMIAQHAVKKSLEESSTRSCQECMTEGHSAQALYCLNCGSKLTEYFGESPKLDPKLSLPASMIYMINADGRIEPEEIDRLLALVRNDRDLLEVASRYTKSNSIDEFLDSCEKILSKDQKLSVLINLYDSILSEGDALEQEIDLFDTIKKSFGILDQDIEPYLHSIKVKNNKDLFA